MTCEDLVTAARAAGETCPARRLWTSIWLRNLPGHAPGTDGDLRTLPVRPRRPGLGACLVGHPFRLLPRLAAVAAILWPGPGPWLWNPS